MNLYGYDELGTIATLGGHELRAKLVPGRDLDRSTVEVRIEGVPRATTQISRKGLLAADVGTIRQLENRVASLPSLPSTWKPDGRKPSPASSKQTRHWQNPSNTPKRSKPPNPIPPASTSAWPMLQNRKNHKGAKLLPKRTLAWKRCNAS